MVVVFICNLMRIGRFCQEHEVLMEADVIATCDELGFAFGETLVGVSQL